MITEENTCNASIPTDVETINTFIAMLKMNFPNSDFKDTYYKQLGSTGEKNIPLKAFYWIIIALMQLLETFSNVYIK